MRFLIILGILVVVGFSIFSYNITHRGGGKYYVDLYPNNGVKNYKVVADISEDGDYFIEKAYFPNGGYVSFDNEFAVVPLKFNKKVEIQDDNGRTWYVELTHQKVTEPGLIWGLAWRLILIIVGFALFFIDWTLYLLFGDEEGDDPYVLNKMGDRLADFLDRFSDGFLTFGYWTIRTIGAILLIIIIFSPQIKAFME